MMKSMSENNNGNNSNNSSSSNWLGFSLSPHLEMEAASSPPAAVQVEVSNSLFLSPLQHLNSSSAQCFSGNGHSSGFHQPPLLTAMPIKSDGSLCIMESHSEGLVATSSPKLENFLGAANHQYASHERETMALSLDSIYYHHQQQHNAEQEEANRQHSLNMFQHHHSYYGVGDFFQAPMVETKGDMSDCNAQISEMANWVARSYSTQQGMEHHVGGGGSDTTANIATTMVDNGGSGSIASMACGDIQSLTLSMSPGSQSSCVTPTAQISPSPADCLTMESKKRGFGKVGQKQPVHRKSIDTFGQRTSQYRGVTKHRWTGRYEAHLWDNSCKKEGQTRKGRQVYLGGYDMEEKAARAYDLAALKYWGPSTHTNFPLENYKDELEEMKNMTRQEYVAHLRRKSSGFSRGASMYRGVTRHHQHGRWQARIGRVAGNKDLYLGTFSTQEEAAEAYDIAAIKFRGVSAVTNFDITRYDVEKIMSSNTLLAGEQAKKIKALEQNKNKTPIDDNSSGWKMVNTSLDDLQKQHNSGSNHHQSVGDEATKMASVQFSNGSSIVTSLNSSSREGSPDKSGSSPNILMTPKPPNIAWISPAQLRPATAATPMAHLPFFAAWINDA